MLGKPAALQACVLLLCADMVQWGDSAGEHWFWGIAEEAPSAAYWAWEEYSWAYIRHPIPPPDEGEDPYQVSKGLEGLQYGLRRALLVGRWMCIGNCTGTGLLAPVPSGCE